MIEVYSWATPNGHKVHIMLEECGLPYRVVPVDIGAGDQFEHDFLAPAKIVFGWGRRAEVGRLAATLGTRAFVVCGSRTLERAGVLVQLCDSLGAAGVAVAYTAFIGREPEVADVDAAASEVRALRPRPGAAWRHRRPTAGRVSGWRRRRRRG